MRMRALVPFVLIVALASAAGYTAGAQSTAAPALAAPCGSSTASQVRTTLYFGMSKPNGTVSELDWQLFLRDEVTPRFPSGLTTWDAQGQWQGAKGDIEHERSKVLLLVYPDNAASESAVQAVIERYRKMFEQESVLWETSRVCVAS